MMKPSAAPLRVTEFENDESLKSGEPSRTLINAAACLSTIWKSMKRTWLHLPLEKPGEQASMNGPEKKSRESETC